jgi:hypothetical protein
MPSLRIARQLKQLLWDSHLVPNQLSEIMECLHMLTLSKPNV